ncbi:hypothetical protein [Pararhodobacter sp.]|uniref:hypothetical protein n=1 Tax=Pararhodobacter sp. TaxID=2127056 RepID=UPI002FDEA400
MMVPKSCPVCGCPESLKEVHGGMDWLMCANCPAAIPYAWTATDVLKETNPEITPAIIDVLAERQRQVTVEGWTPEHDDTHENGDMARAAACYALTAAGFPAEYVGFWFWPWLKFWKPTTPRRDLVKAGALILAEIQRLDRLKAGTQGND